GPVEVGVCSRCRERARGQDRHRQKTKSHGGSNGARCSTLRCVARATNAESPYAERPHKPRRRALPRSGRVASAVSSGVGGALRVVRSFRERVRTTRLTKVVVGTAFVSRAASWAG